MVLVLTYFINFQAGAAVNEEAEMSFNAYASHVNLMQYKGYQDDLIATFDFKLYNSKIHPFARASLNQFSYLPPGVSGDYISDQRISVGMGLDYFFTDVLRARLIIENINNKLSSTHYVQESYGLIYNQYFEFTHFQMNNYAEAFLIPRVSNKAIDTFARIQVLRTFYLHRTQTCFHALYPFAQFKTKFNDNSLFGVSGQSLSGGIGYKFYGTSGADQADNFSALGEVHSVAYRSRDFNGDWIQFMVAVQLGIQ